MTISKKIITIAAVSLSALVMASHSGRVQADTDIQSKHMDSTLNIYQDANSKLAKAFETRNASDIKAAKNELDDLKGSSLYQKVKVNYDNLINFISEIDSATVAVKNAEAQPNTTSIQTAKTEVAKLETTYQDSDKKSLTSRLTTIETTYNKKQAEEAAQKAAEEAARKAAEEVAKKQAEAEAAQKAAEDAAKKQAEDAAAKTQAETTAAASAASAAATDTTQASSGSAGIATRNGFSASSAKEAIAMTESGGSYTAQNGQYIGRYQLSASYLNGDTSPANQERVADAYVASRYGTWENAWAFHQANNWY